MSEVNSNEEEVGAETDLATLTAAAGAVNSPESARTWAQNLAKSVAALLAPKPAAAEAEAGADEDEAAEDDTLVKSKAKKLKKSDPDEPFEKLETSDDDDKDDDDEDDEDDEGGDDDEFEDDDKEDDIKGKDAKANPFAKGNKSVKKSLAEDLEDQGMPVDAFDAGPLIKGISDRIDDNAAAVDDISTVVEKTAEATAALEKSFKRRIDSLETLVKSLAVTVSRGIAANETLVKSLSVPAPASASAAPVAEPVAPEVPLSAAPTVFSPEAIIKSLQDAGAAIPQDLQTGAETDPVEILKKSFLNTQVPATPGAIEKRGNLTKLDLMKGLRTDLMSETPTVPQNALYDMQHKALKDVPVEWCKAAAKANGTEFSE